MYRRIWKKTAVIKDAVNRYKKRLWITVELPTAKGSVFHLLSIPKKPAGKGTHGLFHKSTVLITSSADSFIIFIIF